MGRGQSDLRRFKSVRASVRESFEGVSRSNRGASRSTEKMKLTVILLSNALKGTRRETKNAKREGML